MCPEPNSFNLLKRRPLTHLSFIVHRLIPNPQIKKPRPFKPGLLFCPLYKMPLKSKHLMNLWSKYSWNALTFFLGIISDQFFTHAGDWSLLIFPPIDGRITYPNFLGKFVLGHISSERFPQCFDLPPLEHFPLLSY
jgi:hypothetical protein